MNAFWAWLLSLFQPKPAPPPARVYKFQDEFNGPAGSRPDPTKWVHTLAGSAPGAPSGNLVETIIVDNPANSFLDGNSNLVLRATPVTMPLPAWAANNPKYQSPWVTTLGKFSAGVGSTFEARIKFTRRNGCWPCFSLMGVNGSWPAGGEVDVIEIFASYSSSTVHTPKSATASNMSSTPVACDDDWHTWRVQWNIGGLTFFKDGTLYFTVAASSLPNWVFDGGNPLYMLLTMAVSGPKSAGAAADPSKTVFPVDMLVDWVHVW